MTSRSRWPLTATIRSPRASPAAAAGVRGLTAATTTPIVSTIEGVFRRLLPLHAGGRVQEPHALDDVLQAREDREARREPDHRPGRQLELKEARQQAGEDREDLEEG